MLTQVEEIQKYVTHISGTNRDQILENSAGKIRKGPEKTVPRDPPENQ